MSREALSQLPPPPPLFHSLQCPLHPSPLSPTCEDAAALQSWHCGCSGRPLALKSDAAQGKQIPYLDNSPGTAPERIQLITRACFPRAHNRLPTELPLHSGIKLTSFPCVPYRPSCKHARVESVMQIDLSTSMGSAEDNTAGQYCTVTVPNRGQIRQCEVPITPRHIRFSLREICAGTIE